MCARVCAHVYLHAFGGQQTTCKSWLSSTRWRRTPRTEPKTKALWKVSFILTEPSLFLNLIFNFWDYTILKNYTIFSFFFLSLSPHIFTSPLFFKFIASFSLTVIACNIYIPKYDLLSPYYAACMYVYRFTYWLWTTNWCSLNWRRQFLLLASCL